MLKIFDTGHIWNAELERAAIMRNFPVRRVARDEPCTDLAPLGFLIPRQFDEKNLMDDKKLAEFYIESGQHFVQDVFQIRAYEDKIAQTNELLHWMPATHIAACWSDAMNMLDAMDGPVISKSAYGSASHNVRLLNSKTEKYAEILQVFGGEGLPTRRGPGPSVMQKDYLIWQEFIPHAVTRRVTIVGTKLHVYKRFNHPDRPMAAPSCVVQTQPVPMNDEVESLLEFSRAVFDDAETKWCAIDVLKDAAGKWLLLETSLAWARGNDPSGNANFYGTKRSLNTQFDLLLDEVEAGSFAEC